MSFSLKKREIVMLVVLGLLLYVFVFVKFVWQPVVPNISEKQGELAGLQKQKADMDSQMANLAVKRDEVAAKQAVNEKLNEYLFESAGIGDGVETVDKLARMVGKSLEKISISKPAELVLAMPQNNGENQQNADQKAEGKKYYEFKIDFNTKMTYREALDLLAFCENGTRRITVNKITMTPEKPKEGQNNQTATAVVSQDVVAGTAKAGVNPPVNAGKNMPPVQQPVQAGTPAQSQTPPAETAVQSATSQVVQGTSGIVYDVGMSISFYALNVGNLNKMYDYSKGSFKKFDDSNMSPFISPKLDKEGKIILPDVSQGGDGGTGNLYAYYRADAVLEARGIFVGGDNFNFFSTADLKDYIRITSLGRVKVKLELSGSKYELTATDVQGRDSSISGVLPVRDFYVAIDSNIPGGTENKDVGLDLSIRNDSDRNVGIRLKDLGGRVRITDRNGNTMMAKNELEKTYLL